MRFISHCRYGGEMTVERDDFDCPLEFISFAKVTVRQKFGSRPVGGMCGRYMWQEIWRKAAPSLGMEGRSAPEWLIYKDCLLVRDRFMAPDLLHLFIDGEQLRGRIWTMANGARVVREVEAQSDKFFRKLDERSAA